MVNQTFLTSCIKILHEIDCDSALKNKCAHYSVYDNKATNDKFFRRLNSLLIKAYNYGFVPANYRDTLSAHRIDDENISASDSYFIDNLDEDVTLAIIGWHYRRDHFREGCLINNSIASGDLLRLFSHLQELQNIE